MPRSYAFKKPSPWNFSFTAIESWIYLLRMRPLPEQDGPVLAPANVQRQVRVGAQTSHAVLTETWGWSSRVKIAILFNHQKDLVSLVL